MKFIVYKTTNLLTGQYYIGKHTQETDDFDGYFGSGIRLRRAIAKYGKENFIREIMGEYRNDEQAYIAEIAILGNSWESDPLCYNMSSGGYGLGKGFKMTEETKHKMKSRRPGYKHSAETRKKIGLAQVGNKNHMFGTKRSEEDKNKISKGLTGKYAGEKNSRFKGYYITPFGKFDSAQAISESVTTISRGTVCHWCKNSNKIITKSMIGNSKYLQESALDKTFKEIGFYMETK
jgi:group I intron endonuclease